MDSIQIIKRAVLLADLENSGYITYEDKCSSINEAYRDVYERLVQQDDDYYLKSADLDLATYQPIDTYQFSLELPADCYRLRLVEYEDTGYWREIPKFPLNTRGKPTSVLGYRFRGNTLWFSGLYSAAAQVPAIRVVYYPPADTVLYPQDTLDYLTSVSPYSIHITSMVYVPLNRTLLYSDGTTIKAESLDLVSTVTLYTDTGMTSINFKNGYIYFLKGGEIWRGSTDFSSTMTPVAITSTGGTITSYSISGNYIYYVSSPDTYKCALDGTGATLAYAFIARDVCQAGSSIAYLTNTGVLTVDGVATTITAQTLRSDNTTLYYLDSAGNLYAYDLTISSLLASKVSLLGKYGTGFLPILTTDNAVEAISTIVPTSFDYPLNLTYEIMSYRCAADFKRKNGADSSQIEARLAGLWNRFISQVRRDDYKPERIQNAYYGMYSPWR